MRHFDVENIHDEEVLKSIIKWQEKQMGDCYRIMRKYRKLCEEIIAEFGKENKQ